MAGPADLGLGDRQSLTADLALALVMTGRPERAVEVLDAGRRGWLTEGLRAAGDTRSRYSRACLPSSLPGWTRLGLLSARRCSSART